MAVRLPVSIVAVQLSEAEQQDMKLLFTRQFPPEEAQLEGDGDGGEGEGGLTQPPLLTSSHGQEPVR